MTHKQTTKRFIIAPVFTILCGLVLGACSYYDNLSVDDINVFSEPDPIFCPSVSILAKSDRLTIFKEGPGRDITDILNEATMVDFVASCVNQINKETYTGQVIVQLAVGFAASRGPANKDARFTLPYFVTLMDKNKNIINKVNFDFNGGYDGNRYKVSGMDEIVTLTIPITPPLTGDDFLIYIGFQLTPDQLKYNQHSG